VRVAALLKMKIQIRSGSDRTKSDDDCPGGACEWRTAERARSTS